jgi:hypothetical protein
MQGIRHLPSVTNSAQLAEFPFTADLPKREKTKVGKVLDALDEILRLTEDKGPAVCQKAAASFLGVSVQRVGQFLDDGKMEFWTIEGTRYVYVKSLKEFAKLERKTGRPPKPKGMLEKILA